MKKFASIYVAYLAVCLSIFISAANAQNKAFTKEQGLQLVRENAATLGFTPDNINEIVVSDAYYDKTANVNLVYVQQTYKGVKIYNAIKAIAFRNGKVMSNSGTFYNKLSTKANSTTAVPEIAAAVAVANAATNVDRPITAAITPLSGNDPQKIEFPSYDVSQQNIVAKLLWVADEVGNLHLSWQVRLAPVRTSDYWLINVDAKTGTVINKDNLTVNDVWEKPNANCHGDQSGIAENNQNIATPFSPEQRGANSTNSASATYRVAAYPAESPKHPGGTPMLVTDPFNNAGATNLVTALGWHNDSATDYTYTRGNNVWAREDRANNNGIPTPGTSAASSTPLPSLTFDYPYSSTTSPTIADNQKFAITQLFYWNNIMHDITYQYGFDEVSGNFQKANLDRGGIGNDYVIADAQDGGGTNNANFSTQEDGITPRMQMYIFTTTTPNKDGDLDNGVIGHEYAHGISNRLTGGPSTASCLSAVESRGMGEGWSDYFGLMTTTNWQTAQVTDGQIARPIGTYVLGQSITGAGIRNYPYSTKMTVNPWTYSMLASSTQGEVHNIGEIWAAALWDMTWAIIQNTGLINPNLYDGASNGGNSIALKLVTEGMKLQPCTPGFIDARDAILKADELLYGGQYSCLIWKAFAKRGMGVKAKQGSSASYTDQTGDFTLPDATITKSVDKAIADQNQDITYTINVTCKCVTLTNYKVVDTIDTNLVDYVSGGTYDAPTSTVNFVVPTLLEGQSQSFNFTAKVKAGSYFTPVTLLTEDIAGSSIPVTFNATATGSGAWSVSNTRASSGAYSFKASDPATTSKHTITSTGSFLLSGVSILSFSHFYNTEADYDGGNVEITTNGGISWVDAGPYMFENGYNSILGATGKLGFGGNSNAFVVTKINLASFKGKSIKIRFIFNADAGVGGEGWYVDDILLESKAGIYNVARLFNGSNVLAGTADTTTLITNVFPLTWGGFTAQKEGKTALLKWTTLQEQNTQLFYVQRSSNGISFESIGVVKAAGNSNTQRTYTLTDGVPAKGINYYRIKQVDNDGKFGYSETRSLTFDRVNTLITISPNPAKGKISITVPGNKKALQVTVHSAKGEKVGSFVINGEYSKLNLPVYPSGVYYFTITGDEVSSTQKLIIE